MKIQVNVRTYLLGTWTKHSNAWTKEILIAPEKPWVISSQQMASHILEQSNMTLAKSRHKMGSSLPGHHYQKTTQTITKQ